jgi:hypothetical protein
MGGSATPSAQTPAVQTTDTISAALDAAPEVSGGYAIVRKLAMHPDGGAPPIIINFVSDGPAQGGVPCIGCVNGASTGDNIGLTGPSSFIPLHATWQYSISFTDVNYEGKCTVAWAITNGAKTIDSFSASFNLTSKGGFVLYALNRNRPAYHGGATLTGKVTCGKSKPSLSAPLHFQ